MFSKYSTRREFLNYGKFSALFLLNSCGYVTKKELIAIQNSFYPDSFKDTFPGAWQQKNINLGSIDSGKNRNIILNSDLALINDGWLSRINFQEFVTINESLLSENLDRRSIDFINNFDENQRNKLLPVGVIPYAVIIKNNKDLIKSANQSWDFLLSGKLTKKIIFPKSPRIILSIANKINSSNSLSKLKSQALLFDDQNSINWLINSEASVAIVPYSLCSKYFRIDSRLTIVFPNHGVPLMWHFILRRLNTNNELLIRWIKSLGSRSNAEKLARQGWYLPFKNNNSRRQYNPETSNNPGPSQECWDNSWSYPPLNKAQKINLEDYWKKSLTP